MEREESRSTAGHLQTRTSHVQLTPRGEFFDVSFMHQVTRRHHHFENGCHRHSTRLLCMANRGPDTNGSQFFITLRACPHLNGTYCVFIYFTFSWHNCAGFTRARTTPGKHVVFGKVIRGFDDVVRKITQVSTDEKDRPVVPVIVYNCGELELRKKVAPLRTCNILSFFFPFWKCDGKPLIAHHVLSFQRMSPL